MHCWYNYPTFEIPTQMHPQMQTGTKNFTCKWWMWRILMQKLFAFKCNDWCLFICRTNRQHVTPFQQMNRNSFCTNINRKKLCWIEQNYGLGFGETANRWKKKQMVTNTLWKSCSKRKKKNVGKLQNGNNALKLSQAVPQQQQQRINDKIQISWNRISTWFKINSIATIEPISFASINAACVCLYDCKRSYLLRPTMIKSFKFAMHTIQVRVCR